jgi:hypothetical protein
VRSEGAIAQPVAYRMAAVAMADGAGPPPPMEGGKNAVTIVVSGTVVLGPAR